MYRCSRSSWPQNILTDFQGSMLKIFLYILFQALLSLFSSVTCCFPNAFLRLLTTSRRKARSGVNNTMLTTTILLQFEFDTILDHCTNAWFWLMKSSSLHFWYKGNLCFFIKKEWTDKTVVSRCCDSPHCRLCAVDLQLSNRSCRLQGGAIPLPSTL